MIYISIVSILSSIPRPVLAVLACAIYGACVRWRFSWPMLLDGLLIGLLIYRPSLGLLAWVGFLMALRHVAPIADALLGLFNARETQGMTAHLILFTLPSLRTYAGGSASARDLPGDSGVTLALAPPIAAAPAPPAAQQLAPLQPVEWLGAVNDDQTAPHLGVVGPTRLGKTTFVLAALGRRAGLIVITTPKSKDADPWGGALAIRLRIDLAARSVDWTPIESAIDAVHFEMLRRNATNTAKDAPRLNLIVDELSTTLANCARKTKSQILELWNMGAGANINLIVCDPEVNSAAWGIQGRRDILGNLLFAKVGAGRQWSIGRLDPNGGLIDPRPLDTTPLLTLAGQAQLGGREWVSGAGGGVSLGVPPVGAVGAAGGSLGAGVPPGLSGVGVGGVVPLAASQSADADRQTDADAEREARIATYMAWQECKITRVMAKVIRNREGLGLDNNEWAEAGKRLAP